MQSYKSSRGVVVTLHAVATRLKPTASRCLSGEIAELRPLQLCASGWTCVRSYEGLGDGAIASSTLKRCPQHKEVEAHKCPRVSVGRRLPPVPLVTDHVPEALPLVAAILGHGAQKGQHAVPTVAQRLSSLWHLPCVERHTPPGTRPSSGGGVWLVVRGEGRV